MQTQFERLNGHGTPATAWRRECYSGSSGQTLAGAECVRVNQSRPSLHDVGTVLPAAPAPLAETPPSVQTRIAAEVVVVIQPRIPAFPSTSSFSPEPNVGTVTMATNSNLLRIWLRSRAGNRGMNVDLRPGFLSPFAPACAWTRRYLSKREL